MTSSPEHPFVRAPHRTLVGLSVPVLFSLVAEPVTGLVDTAFVARLGAPPLAALGVGTIVLSSVFWIFNFLGIGTQTEVAAGTGRRDDGHAARMNALAMALGAGFGLLALVAGYPAVGGAASLMGAEGVFGPAWLAAVLVQPLNALSFGTDGIHWGTGDYRFLRNVVLLATIVGAAGLYFLDEGNPAALTHVWLITAVWITIRAALGLARIWPGIGNAPLHLGCP